MGDECNMSQTKYKLSKQRRRRCIAEIQEYDETVEWYRQMRWQIINASPKPSEVYIDHNSTGRPTEDKQARLERLEAHPRVAGMKAIDDAKQQIGREQSDSVRQKLIKAIWTSCILEYTFKYAPHEPELHMGPNAFYERRRKFLWNIAERLYDMEIE